MEVAAPIGSGFNRCITSVLPVNRPGPGPEPTAPSPGQRPEPGAPGRPEGLDDRSRPLARGWQTSNSKAYRPGFDVRRALDLRPVSQALRRRPIPSGPAFGLAPMGPGPCLRAGPTQADNNRPTTGGRFTPTGTDTRARPTLTHSSERPKSLPRLGICDAHTLTRDLCHRGRVS